MHLLFLLFVATIVSCTKTPPSTAQPVTTEASENLYTGLIATKYDSKLQPDLYSNATSRNLIPLLRWDFSDDFSVSYNLTQEMVGETRFHVSQDSVNATPQNITASGSITVQSSGGSTAELLITDLQTTTYSGTSNKETKQNLPPMTLQGFTEDSQLSAVQSSQSGGTDRLFALPSEQLTVGQSISFPKETPFNAMGSLLIVKGETIISIPKLVKIDNKLCAQLKVVTIVNQLDIPEQLEGEYTFQEQSISILYFDIKAQQFVEGTMVSLMEFSIDVPNPNLTLEDAEKYNLPERSIMDMKTESFIQYSLK
jgi:hypothetical protein